MAGVARFDWRTIAVVVVVAVAVLVGMIAISGGESSQSRPRPRPTTSEPAAVELEFAVWGSAPEIAAYQAVVDDYNASSTEANVTLRSWPDADAMLAATGDTTGEDVPDLYLLPRSELAATVAAQRNRPLLDLLVEREVAIGDDFAREAVAAFSVDDDLQCMPYTATPMLIYYNTRLVNFERMEAQGLPTPNPDHSGWNLEEFRAAAEFATRPRQRTRGVHIEPTLQGLAPFVYSGGGRLFDDDNRPRRLALSDDDATEALGRTLELLRDPRLTLTSRQLERRSALQWFKRGSLGMIAGYRGLTPELRAVKGLQFDVMPMPSLGSNQTIAEMTGVCLAPGRPTRVTAAADFLSYLVSDEAVARVTESGHLQPANIRVALSRDFQQPGQEPAHAMVFTNAMRTVVVPPLLEEWEQLRALVDPDIQALLTVPALEEDLEELLAAIDERSRALLDPDYEPEESGASSPSGSPSGVPSD